MVHLLVTRYVCCGTLGWYRNVCFVCCFGKRKHVCLDGLAWQMYLYIYTYMVYSKLVWFKVRYVLMSGSPVLLLLLFNAIVLWYKPRQAFRMRFRRIYMGVNPKIGVFTPQIINFNRGFHYKPSILGYHYFWKHP